MSGRRESNPLEFIIVGLDDGYQFVDIAPRLTSQRDIDILRYACMDTERLKEDLPDDFVAGFELTGSKVDAIHFWQVIDKDGISLPLVTDGRSRTLALRLINAKRAQDGAKALPLDAHPDVFLGKYPPKQALRLKRLRNRHIPDTLGVLAEQAGEWCSLGETPETTAVEMGVSVARVSELLAWAALYPKFCDEARRRANDGRMRLRGAKELIAKFPVTADQEAYFAGKVAMRGEKTAGPRPISPRTLDIFIEQVTAHADRGTLALMRVLRGDADAAKELPEHMRAGWLRAQEAAKKKPRAK